MLSAVLVGAWVRASVQDQPPIVPEVRPGKNGRGRDPWVFRLIFEDRTRMVAVALKQDLWYVFNPETCAPFKVWTGKMDFRGKVWDFSQDNSRAQGTVHAAAPSEVLTLDANELGKWTANGVSWQGAWKFAGDRATLTSPSFDLQSWQRVFVAFDEQSRRGRIKVEVSSNGGRTWDAENFYSATAVTNDTDWQWNFRQLLTMSPTTRVRFVQESAAHQKTLRYVRIFGDQAAWLDRFRRPLEVFWRGYELKNETDSVSFIYDVVLASGRTINVRHRPEATTNGWSELVSVHGLQVGDEALYWPIAPGAGVAQKIHEPGEPGTTSAVQSPLRVTRDGDILVTYEVAR